MSVGVDCDCLGVIAEGRTHFEAMRLLAQSTLESGLISPTYHGGSWSSARG